MSALPLPTGNISAGTRPAAMAQQRAVEGIVARADTTLLDQVFDRVAELAAQICAAPFAVITRFVPGHHTPLAIHGQLPLTDMPRDSAFCCDVVHSGRSLEVTDALHDLRFHRDPIVTSAPHIRFFAGLPVVSDGLTIGTISVMDIRPGCLTAQQRAALTSLADTVARLVEGREHQRQAAWLGDILEHSLNEIVVFDGLTHRVVHANQGALRNLGYTPDEMRELTGIELSTDWNVERRDAVQGALLSGAQMSVSVEVTARRKDGTTYPAESRIQLAGRAEQPLYVLISNDISARKVAEEALYQEKELAQVTLESIGDAMITTDAAGRVRYLNPVAERLTGWTQAEAAGQTLEDVFHIVSETDRAPVESPVARVLREGRITGLANHTLLIARDGSEYSVEDSAAPIRARDGALAGVVMVFRDVTRARELANHLSWQASHDTLTDLVNRREFENVIKGLLTTARSHDRQHVLLYIDLDQFKVVNDTCGHLAGDALLRQLSHVLLATMRKSDTLARLGGDEFGVLLEGCDIQQARRLAGQLLDAIRSFRFAWQERIFAVGASIGMVEINSRSVSVEDILAAADTACFLAKDKGRGQIQVFEMEDEEISSRHGEMGWVSRITQCLEDDRFYLACQRVAHVQDTERTEYLEILLRMRDEQGRPVPPMAFIPAAERYGLMPAVDRWVVKRALHCLGRMRQGLTPSHPQLRRFAINLSGASLSDPAFLDFVLEQFDLSGAPPDAVCFEITESAAIANLSRAVHFMRRLKEEQCRFALDDFGSGLSSFTYLKNLPVDYLKIDGSFVRDVVTDRIDRAMIESIHRVGRVMNIRTIAEFVEGAAALQCLRDIGVDFAQGHFLHAPESYQALAARLAEHRMAPLLPLAACC